MEKITKEELLEKLGRIPLSDDELDMVSGGYSGGVETVAPEKANDCVDGYGTPFTKRLSTPLYKNPAALPQSSTLASAVFPRRYESRLEKREAAGNPSLTFSGSLASAVFLRHHKWQLEKQESAGNPVPAFSTHPRFSRFSAP